MLIPISINSDDLIDQFSMSKSEAEEVVDFAIKEIAAKFYEFWQEEAQLSLNSTRSRYLENLTLIDSGRMEGAIILDYTKDSLIRMIEEGCSAFDLKSGFEKSSKVKFNKSGGWYLTIPFKLGTPDTIGDLLGITTNLPNAVYNIVKKQKVNPISGRSAGLSSDQVPEQYKAPQTRAKIEVPKSKNFEAYTHKSSLYQGVFKQTDKITGQNSYGSFRRVGENSEAGAFIHPGLPELNLAEQAMSKLDSVMELELTRSLNAALSNFGFGE